MKKKITKIMMILLGLLIVFPIQAHSEEPVNAGLDIDSSAIVNEKASGYKSELDMYNIELFTENEEERAKREKEENELETQRLCDSLFNKSMETEEEELSEEVARYNLFSSKVIPDKIAHIETKENSKVKYIIIIAVGCLLTGILTRLYYIKKYKGEKDDFEHYNYARL